MPPKTLPRSWAPSLALIAMALLGHIAMLSLIDSPPFAVYQHYWPWSQFLSRRPIGLFVLVFQASVCLGLTYRARRDLVEASRRIAPAWTLLLAVGVLGFSSAIPTESVSRSVGEAVMSCVVMGIAGLNYILAIRALPLEGLRRIRAALSRKLTISADRGVRPWDRRLPIVAAVWVLIVSSVVAVWVFERVPHIDDSVAYLFQAKYMSTGTLWLQRPPDPESFGVAHLIVDGDKWYSKFFPGWPAVLALGVILGVPWLVNPLLASASVLLTHAVVRRIYDLRTAHAVTLLISVSPWLLFLSGSMMAHAASLFWLMLALLAIDCQRGRSISVWAPVAGASLGMLFLTRPFEATLVGPVVGLWGLGLGARRLSIGALATVGGTAAMVASLYFLYNAVMTGSPGLAPHQVWGNLFLGPGIDVFGFGPNVGNVPMWRNQDPLPGHGLADVVLNTNKNLALTNFELFGWAFGSLALACVALQPRGLQRRDGLIVGLILSVIIGHAFYWAHGGPDFGARYWYLLIVPLTILTVRGADMALFGLSASRGDSQAIAARVAAFVALASLGALLAVVPWRATVKYHRYRGIGRDFATLAEVRGITDAIVIVRSPERSDYQAAFTFNPPTLDGKGNVFVRDTGGKHLADVLKYFAGRAVWLVGRDPDTDRRLRVLAGPLPPGTLPPGPALTSEQTLQVIVR